MVVRSAARHVLTFALMVLLAVRFVAPALAASQLSAIRVAPDHNGARVTLAIPGGPPVGWHATGSGTAEVTIVLPNTVTSPTLGQLSYAGVNDLGSVTVSTVANEVDVGLHLSSAAPIQTVASTNGIVIQIAPSGPPQAVPPPGQATAPATNGPTGRTYEVVPLKYADVSEVVGVLVDGQQVPPNDTFTPQGSIFSLPSSVNGTTAPQQPAQFFNQNAQQAQSFGQRVNDNIAIDRRLNAVILSGTPAEIAALREAIAKIDVPLPSVMLECEVVELSESSAHDLGLDFTSGPGTPVLSAGGSVQTATSGNTPQSYELKGQANLFATISHGGGRILATPRILALNGTPAQILTGDALPIITTTLVPSNPPITQQTVSYIAVGVNLQIQPRITEDNFVTSHIFAEVSSVTAYVPTQQGSVPQISLRQASTNATVADGQPFVVGGLLRDEEISTMSRIPGLGNLPIIGGLFRVRHDSNVRTNLYVIITPHIVHNVGQSNVNVPPERLPKPKVPGPVPFRTPPPGK